jgi:hypothetical protein
VSAGPQPIQQNTEGAAHWLALLTSAVGAEVDYMTISPAGATLYLRSAGDLIAWLDARQKGWRRLDLVSNVVEIDAGVYVVFRTTDWHENVCVQPGDRQTPVKDAST